jgi:hypothetical protein
VKAVMPFCISIFVCIVILTITALGAGSDTNSYLPVYRSNTEENGIKTEKCIGALINYGSEIFEQSFYSKNKMIHNGISIGYWSDKLALVPYREYLSINKNDSWAKLAAQLLNQSFDVAGKSAQETSEKITEAVRGGVSIFGHMFFTPVDLHYGNILSTVQSTMFVRTDIPEAPFLLIFSEKDGLKRGNDLSLNHMGLQFSLTTNLNAVYSRNINITGILNVVKKLTENWTCIDNVSLINGLTVVVGHAMLDVSATDGGIHLNSEGTEMFADVTFKIRSCGIGIRNDNGINLKTENGFPVTGIGAGINTGIMISGDNTVMTLGFRRFGPMIWKNVKEKELALKTANIVIADLLEHNYDLFDQDRGGSVSEIDTGNVLHDSPAFVCWLPAGLVLSLTQKYTLKYKKNRPVLPEYIIPSFKYEQPFVSWTGMCSKPGVSFTNEIGMVQGWIPLSFGWNIGYGRVISSFLGAGVNGERVSAQIGYEAVGTPFWYPKRGCSLYIGLFSG